MRRSIREIREEYKPAAIAVRNMIRRFIVTLTGEAGLWQVEGHEGERADDVEVFGNIGFFSRPPASGNKAEAIVAHVGGESGHPVVIATRDRSTQPELEPDETAIHNSQKLVGITGSTVRLGAMDASESVIKGDTYRQAEDTMLSAMSSAFTALGQTAAASAISTFQAAAATYLSTVSKTE